MEKVNYKGIELQELDNGDYVFLNKEKIWENIDSCIIEEDKGQDENHTYRLNGISISKGMILNAFDNADKQESKKAVSKTAIHHQPPNLTCNPFDVSKALRNKIKIKTRKGATKPQIFVGQIYICAAANSEEAETLAKWIVDSIIAGEKLEEIKEQIKKFNNQIKKQIR